MNNPFKKKSFYRNVDDKSIDEASENLTQEASESKSNTRRHGIPAWVVIIPAILVVGAAALLFLLTRTASEYVFRKEAEQIYCDSVYRIQTGSTMTVSSNGEVTLKQGELLREMNSIPVYFRGKDAMLIAHKMIYVQPWERIQTSISVLTNLEHSDSDLITLKRDNKEAKVSGGFLYDGDDLFVFLEPVTLKFNGYRFELGALSYVEADYKNNIMVYDRATGECFMEPAETVVTATTENGTYTVSLLGCSYETSDGAKALLVVDPDILKTLI